MGKIIVLILICFLGYFAVKWYNKDKDSEVDEQEDVQALKRTLIKKIQRLKTKAEAGVQGAKEELEKSKTDLKEIEKLETKIK